MIVTDLTECLKHQLREWGLTETANYPTENQRMVFYYEGCYWWIVGRKWFHMGPKLDECPGYPEFEYYLHAWDTWEEQEIGSLDTQIEYHLIDFRNPESLQELKRVLLDG